MLSVFSFYRFICLVSFISIISLSELSAQTLVDTTDYVYTPHKISGDFELTGEMDHPAWDEAPSTLLKQQISPNDDQEAPVTAIIKVLYSDKHLYVGFVNEDPDPERIRANITDRDDFLMSDDYVGIILDPYNNNQNAYEFFVNPLGIQMDAMRSGNSENISFDALWYSAASFTDTGYISVIKIPFKSINFPDRNVQNWSIQFFRNYPRNNRYQLSWTDFRLDNSCLLCQNGVLANMENVKSTNTVELLPYGVATQSGSISDPSIPESSIDNGPIKPKVGGSISYSPTSTSSINAVVNPDFSQVETDASQINVNETFALFYSEKRPFFVKDADMFTTREDLFYSRTINNPLTAGKYTHRGNNFTFAFLTAFDRSTPFIIPGKEESSQFQTNVESYNNILRGKYNIGNESHIGGLATTRNYGKGYNYVGTLDWNLLLSDKYFFRGQAGYSTTQELDDSTLHNNQRSFGNKGFTAAFDGEQYTGSMVSTEIAREAKYYNFSLDYKSYSPTFQTQTGFITQTNLQQVGVSQSLSYYPGTNVLSQGNLNIDGAWRYDTDGQFQGSYAIVRLNNNFSGQNTLELNYMPINNEQFKGQMFRDIFRGTIAFRSNTLDMFSFGASLEAGRDIHRTSNPPVLGKGFNFTADATMKPTPRFRFKLDYSYSRLSDLDGTETFYTGDIYRINTRYHFTPKLYTRLIGEYNSFNDQIHIYPLVSYKANPFTKFYAGMTNYLTEFEQSGSGGFRDYQQTERQFFVKFQYLIRN